MAGGGTELIFPVIDISRLISNSQDDKSELKKLESILTSCGCFQAVGHGIPNEFLHRVCDVAERFFALSDDEKRDCWRASDEVEGYGDDLVVSDKQVIDGCFRLFLRVFPEAQRKLNLWPKCPADFGEILHDYAVKVKSLMSDLSKAMALALGLQQDSFLNLFGDQPVMQVRFNFYPPCNRPEVLGVKPHSDRSGITVLLQDKEVEGLQVLKDGTWYTVPVIPHALVINLGDQMQIMTNGIFKSPVHRVLTNSSKLRLSVAMFNEPEPQKEIGPVDSLVSESRPRMYKNVKDFAAFNYECFQKGKVALEEVVLTSTDPSELCINGLSFSRRSFKWANTALVVTVSTRDLDTGHGPLSGVYFQRELERKAALLGGGDFVVPVQIVTDFLDSKFYRLGVKAAGFHHLFSDHITEALQRSLCLFDKELPGFTTKEALLHGVETRTISPVQITCDAETHESTSVKGMYPIGEGAGYAGGIVSAAVDGMYAGLAVAKSFGLLPNGIESILGRANGAGLGNY